MVVILVTAELFCDAILGRSVSLFYTLRMIKFCIHSGLIKCENAFWLVLKVIGGGRGGFFP